jgi:uncharacterized MnhB-related membrane protein
MAGVIVLVATIICAFQALRGPRLLASALWLAGASALVALMMYLLGAPEMAVIELSVGAGLVTVLFVFAINIAGEQVPTGGAVVPKALAWIVVLVSVALLAWANIPALQMPVVKEVPLASVLWDQRQLDTLMQVVLVFTGVLGVLGLLSAGRPHPEKEA